MEFKRYQHIERYGTTGVNEINIGTCYVFPKIDGTNASVWLTLDGQLRAGSRNRELTLEKDNAGFYAAIGNDEKIMNYLMEHPTHRLFGEWLVPHSLKNYKDDAWQKFYIFDVCVDTTDNDTGVEYLPYGIYQPLLEEFELNYIMPLKIIKNGEYDNFVHELDNNIFLVKDGSGVGEGIVIKNYDYYNKYGRQIWAKIVTSEFKERHYKTMGAPVTENKMIEQSIVDDFITSAYVEKEYSKIIVENNGVWNSKMIPLLLGKVYYELICEEMWNILKKYKNPKIDFRVLNTLTINKIKSVKPEIFG